MMIGCIQTKAITTDMSARRCESPLVTQKSSSLVTGGVSQRRYTARMASLPARLHHACRWRANMATDWRAIQIIITRLKRRLWLVYYVRSII